MRRGESKGRSIEDVSLSVAHCSEPWYFMTFLIVLECSSSSTQKTGVYNNLCEETVSCTLALEVVRAIGILANVSMVRLVALVYTQWVICGGQLCNTSQTSISSWETNLALMTMYAITWCQHKFDQHVGYCKFEQSFWPCKQENPGTERGHGLT